MTKTTNETVVTTFLFDEEVATLKAYNNIMRKATTVAKNSGYQTTVSSIISNKEIQIIFTFQNVGHKFVDEMRGTLNRFIDSHKQGAFYQWSNQSFLVVA
jgi:hypothetical protein